MPSNPLQAIRFVTAAHTVAQLPHDTDAEVAFAGCSNAGKSSALNRLAGRRALARTSRTPGRTQQMVVFDLGSGQRLVDLPGYGYAKVPEALRAHWKREIDSYLRSRGSLRGVVLVADIRRDLKPFDRQMLAFCKAMGLPAHVLLTKSDKLSRGRADAALQAARALARAEAWPATFQVFSAHAGTGVEQARQQVMALLAASGPAVAPSSTPG